MTARERSIRILEDVQNLTKEQKASLFHLIESEIIAAEIQEKRRVLKETISRKN